MIEQRTILLIDDTPENLRFLGEILEQKGYEVLVATDGARALKFAASTPAPDLILLDIMMPKMDGHEVCLRLKAAPETAKIPVIFISALGMDGQKIQGYSEGAAGYITKPFQIEDVLTIVTKFLQ